MANQPQRPLNPLNPFHMLELLFGGGRKGGGVPPEGLPLAPHPVNLRGEKVLPNGGYRFGG